MVPYNMKGKLVLYFTTKAMDQKKFPAPSSLGSRKGRVKLSGLCGNPANRKIILDPEHLYLMETMDFYKLELFLIVWSAL